MILDRRSSPSRPAATKTCPFCGETVPHAATRCRACTSTLLTPARRWSRHVRATRRPVSGYTICFMACEPSPSARRSHASDHRLRHAGATPRSRLLRPTTASRRSLTPTSPAGSRAIPDQGTFYGVPGRRHDQLPDNSLEALAAWQTKEDAWLAEARRDRSRRDPVGRRSKAPTRSCARPSKARSAAALCRFELWPVSQMTGWHVQFGYLVTIQPVGTDEARKEALARWSALPGYIDTEIANLREGMRRGYLAPKLQRPHRHRPARYARSAQADTPFLSPAHARRDPAFKQAFTALVGDQLTPGVQALPRLPREASTCRRRATTSPSPRNPDGAACYDAAVRAHSSLADAGQGSPRARPAGGRSTR